MANRGIIFKEYWDQKQLRVVWNEFYCHITLWFPWFHSAFFRWDVLEQERKWTFTDPQLYGDIYLHTLFQFLRWLSTSFISLLYRLRHWLKILVCSRSSSFLTISILIQATIISLHNYSSLTGSPLSLSSPIGSSHTEVWVRSWHFCPWPFCSLSPCWELRILTVAAKALCHLTAVTWLTSCLLHSISVAMASVLFQGHPRHPPA